MYTTSNYARVHKPRYRVHRWDDTQNHKGTDTVKIEISIEVLISFWTTQEVFINHYLQFDGLFAANIPMLPVTAKNIPFIMPFPIKYQRWNPLLLMASNPIIWNESNQNSVKLNLWLIYVLLTENSALVYFSAQSHFFTPNVLYWTQILKNKVH